MRHRDDERHTADDPVPSEGGRRQTLGLRQLERRVMRDEIPGEHERTSRLDQRAQIEHEVGAGAEQTEGEELPELNNTVTGEIGDKLDRLIEFTEAQAIKLEFSDAIAPARGMSYGGLIRILPELEESETFATLIHELAHEMLHKAERRTMTTQAVRETEAEAVAFVVCHALGLETGTGSTDYIQLYHGDANLLKESLEVVQRTSNVILAAISPEVTDRQKSDAEVR